MISISTDTAVRVLAVELGGAPADEGQKRIGDAAQHRYRGGCSTMGDQRVVLVSANWEMHPSHVAALGLAGQLAGHLRASAIPAVREVSIHPPLTFPTTVKAAIRADRVPVALGADLLFR